MNSTSSAKSIYSFFDLLISCYEPFQIESQQYHNLYSTKAQKKRLKTIALCQEEILSRGCLGDISFDEKRTLQMDSFVRRPFFWYG